MVIGIALINDTKTQNVARKISFEGMTHYGIDNESLYMVPHISLKQSFTYQGDLTALEQYFSELFSKIEPFAVKLEGINMIETNPETGILWFDVEESPPLRMLHQTLCKDLQESFDIEPVGFDGDDWHFHSTIIYSKTGIKKLEALYSQIMDSYKDLEFVAREAILFCQFEGESSIKTVFTYQIFPLGTNRLAP